MADLGFRIPELIQALEEPRSLRPFRALCERSWRDPEAFAREVVHHLATRVRALYVSRVQFQMLLVLLTLLAILAWGFAR
jgi:hypothetical protein